MVNNCCRWMYRTELLSVSINDTIILLQLSSSFTLTLFCMSFKFNETINLSSFFGQGNAVLSVLLSISIFLFYGKAYLKHYHHIFYSF